MTNEKIFKKVIKKVEKNGFIYAPELNNINKNGKDITFLNPFNVIFSHNFARYFWGDTRMMYPQVEYMPGVPGSYIAKNELVEVWKIHLQQLVLVEDKFKYLAKFLDE